MQQVTTYSVEPLGTTYKSILSGQDSELVKSFTLPMLPFLPEKHRVDIDIFDFNGNKLESVEDIKSYTTQGVIQKGKVNQLVLKPEEDALSREYKGDVDIQYRFYNDVFSPDNAQDISLYITEVSTDRLEIRSRCLDLSEIDIKSAVNYIHGKLNTEAYFSEIYLEFIGPGSQAIGTNIMTEVLDGVLYVTFRLYSPLPEEIPIKQKFHVLEKVGDPVKFRVTRQVKVIPDRQSYLRGPNYSVLEKDALLGSTEYLNYNKLFSLPVNTSRHNLKNLISDVSCKVSVNFEDYSSFIHFSSAVERLENFRYKMSLLEQYDHELSNTSILPSDVQRYEQLVNGILENFDEYEKYLYYENGPKAWPKDSTTGKNIFPGSIDVEWWNRTISEAEAYDNTNKDILIGTIPSALREDPRNEPAVVFVHMLGQHFDSQWIYAKALADKYKADNRVDFGISKDLVRDAIRELGLKFIESNNSLERLYEAFDVEGEYSPGSETSVEELNQISEHLGTSSNYQPTSKQDYQYELYKRIYHNLPFILKSKGTERGLRALINCFGIPDNLLEIKVGGGTKVDRDTGAYLGPIDQVTSSLDKVRLDSLGPDSPLQYNIVEGTGSIQTIPVLSRYASVQSKVHYYSDDQSQVSIGFNVGGQADKYLRDKLVEEHFDYDDIIGDSTDRDENYRKILEDKRNKILHGLREELGRFKQNLFRSPAAVIRLVRYFDSTLFKSIKEFLPARTAVFTGAIVSDNILHRNRYKPVDTLAELSRVEGEINTAFITGSDGGGLYGSPTNVNASCTKTFNVESVDIITTGSVPVHNVSWSTGQFTGSKPVFDNSPIYNGEFLGSVEQVSDMEIQNNPYRRGGANVSTYDVGAYFLDLPAPITCDLIMNLDSDGEIHKYWQSTVQSNVHSNHITELRLHETGTVLYTDSESVSLQRGPVQPEQLPSRMFIGWTSGSTPNTPETSVSLRQWLNSYHSFGIYDSGSSQEHVACGDLDNHVKVHGIASTHDRMRIKVEKLSKYQGTNLWYGDCLGQTGFVITYATERDTISTLPNQEYEVEVEMDNGTKYLFTFKPALIGYATTDVISGAQNGSSLNTGRAVFNGTTVDGIGNTINIVESVEGVTNNSQGLIVVRLRKQDDDGDIRSYGINRIGAANGGYRYPWVISNTFVDADWKKTYVPNVHITGSWNYNNHHIPTGWEIGWIEKHRFFWKWLTPEINVLSATSSIFSAASGTFTSTIESDIENHTSSSVDWIIWTGEESENLTETWTTSICSLEYSSNDSIVEDRSGSISFVPVDEEYLDQQKTVAVTQSKKVVLDIFPSEVVLAPETGSYVTYDVPVFVTTNLSTIHWSSPLNTGSLLNLPVQLGEFEVVETILTGSTESGSILSGSEESGSVVTGSVESGSVPMTPFPSIFEVRISSSSLYQGPGARTGSFTGSVEEGCYETRLPFVIRLQGEVTSSLAKIIFSGSHLGMNYQSEVQILFNESGSIGVSSQL